MTDDKPKTGAAILRGPDGAVLLEGTYEVDGRTVTTKFCGPEAELGLDEYRVSGTYEAS